VPAYDYRCDRCERTFEVRQRISEAPLATCERCGGPIHRLLAAAPFILKGGGWYVTDYPSEGRKKGIEAEKSASSTSTSPSTASSTSSTPTTSSNSSSSSSSSGDGAAPKPASTPSS
jgi:putative FmdB family regulatory protein